MICLVALAFGAGMENLSTFTNEGAEKIIGRMLIASGKTPDEVMQRYEELYSKSCCDPCGC